MICWIFLLLPEADAGLSWLKPDARAESFSWQVSRWRSSEGKGTHADFSPWQRLLQRGLQAVEGLVSHAELW